MRRFLPAAVLAAPLPLSACYMGPVPVQYAALAVVNGRPTAVVAACGRSTVSVEVYLNDDSAGDDLYSWAVTVTLPHRVREVEVELLGKPRLGWTIAPNRTQTVGTSPFSYKAVPLTSIEAGHRYTIDSSTEGPEGSTAPKVTFTTADLSRIGIGQVLAPADRKRSEVVSRDQFVKARCGQR